MPALTAEQVAFFHREGYVHVPNALAAADLDPVQAELEEIVDRNARPVSYTHLTLPTICSV